MRPEVFNYLSCFLCDGQYCLKRALYLFWVGVIVAISSRSICLVRDESDILLLPGYFQSNSLPSAQLHVCTHCQSTDQEELWSSMIEWLSNLSLSLNIVLDHSKAWTRTWTVTPVILLVFCTICCWTWFSMCSLLFYCHGFDIIVHWIWSISRFCHTMNRQVPQRHMENQNEMVCLRCWWERKS